MEDGQEVIGHFQKSSTASIQVSLVSWEGTGFLDIREVVPSDKPDQAFTFTKKGVRFKAEFLPELIELLKAVPR